MASTFTSLTYHVVFSTKYRKNRITADLQEELYKYIGGIVRDQKGVLLEIGGVADHVHLLTGFSPTVAVSDVVRLIKANSSKWVNEKADTTRKFQWQTGYAAFTVSCSQVDVVRRYIQNQEEHHKTLSFRDEFLALLKRHGIEVDMRYVFEEEHVG
ncbi:MAG: IS200/IS605 family transposase [Planctomycetes bacterium]|nr:IS200/IS605 family transposase [Planctomycetota bacterium]